MIGLLCFAFAVLASPSKSKLRLEAENAALRHQLIVLRRKLRGRVRLANSDRWLFVQLYRWFPFILQVLAIIRQTTHRRRGGRAQSATGGHCRPYRSMGLVTGIGDAKIVSTNDDKPHPLALRGDGIRVIALVHRLEPSSWRPLSFGTGLFPGLVA